MCSTNVHIYQTFGQIERGLDCFSLPERARLAVGQVIGKREVFCFETSHTKLKSAADLALKTWTL